MCMINLIIADDHQKFRSSLADYLSSIPGYRVIAEASNGKQLIEAVEAQKEYAPFVIMDVHMPEMDGVATTSYLSQKVANAKVIGMSVSNDFNHVVRMMRAGAKGFIWKSSLSECITEAIQTIESNEIYTDPCFAGEMEQYVKENGAPAQWKKIDILEQEQQSVASKTETGIIGLFKKLFK